MNPARSEWQKLCERNIPSDTDIQRAVEEIIENVRQNGDKALFEYAERFDGFKGSTLLLSEQEINEAVKQVSPDVAHAIRMAAANIEKFHRAQLPVPVEVTTTP